MTQDKNTPTSLSTMLGSGVPFEAKGKTYTVLPIMVAHIELLQKSKLFLGENQLFNFIDAPARKEVNKWLGGEPVSIRIGDKEITAIYCYDENNEPMSLEKAIADGWDVVDFKRYFKTLCDISG